MEASKPTIYLSKNHKIVGSNNAPTNVLMFNQNGRTIPARWLRKTFELNNGSFVIMDHNNTILKETERTLQKRNYYIETINLSEMEDGICINPFDLVKDTSEIHFMFLSFLYAMWDNIDPDITAMSNLIDAFASLVFAKFENQREKLTMQNMKKMVSSVRANCKTEDGVVPMSDAIFAGVKDQESMPCKYYAQFKKAAGERSEEIAEKVAKMFDMFTDVDMYMMRKTDDSFAESFNFKTAVFVNVNKKEEEHSAKIMMVLLNYFVQRIADHSQVLFVFDDMDAKYRFVSLPHWMKEAHEYNTNYIVICDDLVSFQSTERAERYFRNIKKTVSACILVNHNEAFTQLDGALPGTFDDADLINQEVLARVLIPDENVSEEDVLY